MEIVLPPTRLFLGRHGQTDWNLAGRLQGQTDIPLNDTGRQQAEEARQRLSGVQFDAVYSSPLSRAVETAILVSGWPADRVRTDERIKEIAFGDWEGKAPRTLGDDFAPFFADPARFVPAPGGESLPALMARVSDFTAYVKQAHRGQTVLAVSHGAALHALFTAELGLDMKDYWSVGLGNCAAAELVLEGERFVLKSTSGPTSANYLEKYLK